MTILMLQQAAAMGLVAAAALFVGAHYFAWMSGRVERRAAVRSLPDRGRDDSGIRRSR